MQHNWNETRSLIITKNSKSQHHITRKNISAPKKRRKKNSLASLTPNNMNLTPKNIYPITQTYLSVVSFDVVCVSSTSALHKGWALFFLSNLGRRRQRAFSSTASKKLHESGTTGSDCRTLLLRYALLLWLFLLFSLSLSICLSFARSSKLHTCVCTWSWGDWMSRITLAQGRIVDQRCPTNFSFHRWKYFW